MHWTLLEVIGLVLVVAGVALWSVPAALVVAGVFAVVVGFVQGGER